MILIFVGAFALLLAMMFAFGGVATSVAAVGSMRIDVHSAWAAFGIAAVMFAVCAVSWFRAMKRVPGDDLFSGERGMYFSAILISVAIVASVMVLMIFNIDAWRGVIDGATGR